MDNPPFHFASSVRRASASAVWGWRGVARADILGRVPRKVRQLVADLERAGFARIHGGKGSHRKFVHQKFPGFVLISGHDGNDAQHYQEKQLRNALRTVQS